MFYYCLRNWLNVIMIVKYAIRILKYSQVNGFVQSDWLKVTLAINKNYVILNI